jgi:hypothetical protein
MSIPEWSVTLSGCCDALEAQNFVFQDAVFREDGSSGFPVGYFIEPNVHGLHESPANTELSGWAGDGARGFALALDASPLNGLCFQSPKMGKVVKMLPHWKGRNK